NNNLDLEIRFLMNKFNKLSLAHSVFRSFKQPKNQFLNDMTRRNYSLAAPVSKSPVVPYPVDTSVGPMYRYQKFLPKLPVPSLSETFEKYLMSVKPLVNEEEFENTKKAVEDFLKPGGIGEELQDRLLNKANNPKVINWLEDWWNELAYFGYRDPVCVYVSYFYAYKDDKLRKNPATRAASIVTAALDGKQLSTVEIESLFKKIYEMAGDTKDPPVGALTSENRDNWTDYRNLLLSVNPKNEQLLRKIESSAFVVCLDDTSPITHEEISHSCWVGDGRNRFFDKPLQFIVFENGKAGFCGEHSSMDGMPTHRLNDFICDVIARNKIDHGEPNIRFKLPQPEQLNFILNNDALKAIASAEKNFDSLVSKHDLRVLVYQGYGKNGIKKLGFSPDAYVQMIIQLAYYKMYGVSRSTYESAQTRKFAHGRTEVCRTVSVDSVAWVKSMEDPNATFETKIELGRKAIASHVKYMSDAVDGRGCDRHLLGLRMSLKSGEEKPEIFNDIAFSRSSHWNLSTSQLSSEYFDGYGWGEVVPDGYGIAYQVNANSLHFNIVSMHLNNHHMRHYLNEAANEMKQLFEYAQVKEGRVPSKL
ncbi:9627_t:CDS:2, partial [Diversispora eburnea]